MASWVQHVIIRDCGAGLQWLHGLWLVRGIVGQLSITGQRLREQVSSTRVAPSGAAAMMYSVPAFVLVCRAAVQVLQQAQHFRPLPRHKPSSLASASLESDPSGGDQH